jgi:guanylate cyclase, other
MNHTRIYVFLGNPSSLVDLMASMDTVQLFAKGEYLVIFVDMLTYSPKEAQKYLWKPDQLNVLTHCDQADNFFRRARSLLVVVSTPPTENYENFTEKVRTYNKQPPFNFHTPSLFNNFVKVSH